MPILADVQAAVVAGRYRITRHAVVEMGNDHVELPELLGATQAGEVIENYPTARPFPACLVLGHATEGRPLHTVWAYDTASAPAMLVKVYRPDPAKGSPDLRRRVKP